MQTGKSLWAVLAIGVLSIVGAGWGEGPYPVARIRQLGTPTTDWGFGVAADRLGNVYVTGYTQGSLGGPSAGEEDIFLSKYSAAGSLLWSRQFGSTSDEEAGYAVSADVLGNVFVAGYSCGSLGGPEVGSGGSFLGRYDAAGNLQWLRQFGGRSDESYSLCADGLGNVYVSGMTYGSLGGPSAGENDAFLGKYDAGGNQLWVRQLGTWAHERAYGVSTDGLGNVYIAGYTSGPLADPFAQDIDAFLGKYDTEGNLLWLRQFGPGGNETGLGVSADALGNVFVTGQTDGSLGGVDALVGPRWQGLGQAGVPTPWRSWSAARAGIRWVHLLRGSASGACAATAGPVQGRDRHGPRARPSRLQDQDRPRRQVDAT